MWFFTAIVVLLIGAVAVVASGRWGGMDEAYDDRPDMRVPSDRPLAAEDIESSRFAVGVRGYRMDEVDSLLERLTREIAERDRRIADLERAVRPILQGPDGAAFAPRPVDAKPAGEVVAAPVGRHAAQRSPVPRPQAGPDAEPQTDPSVTREVRPVVAPDVRLAVGPEVKAVPQPVVAEGSGGTAGAAAVNEPHETDEADEADVTGEIPEVDEVDGPAQRRA